MRKIQTTYKKFDVHSIDCMGDSITLNYIWGTMAYEYYPTVLQGLLKEQGCNVKCRNFGVSGNTTTQMLARFGAMTQYDTPKISAIYGGINDGTAYSTITNNLKTMATNMITAGSKVIICLVHYNNYTSGGDTTPTPQGSKLDLWNAQKQAYTDLVALYPNDIAFCDFYAYMRNLIDTAVVTQGDWTAFHVADGNVHLNANGEKTLAQALLASIQAQNWDDLLK